MSGSIWVRGVRELARFDGSVWTRIGRESGFPEGEVNGLYEDRSGNLWAGTFAGAFRKPAGKSSFEAVEPGSTYLQSFAEDRSGGIWVTHARQIVRKLEGREPVDYAPTLRLPAASRRLFADSHGDIWVAAIGSLLRVREKPGGRMLVEPFLTATRGMGSIQTLFEDREQNLWIGMTGGLLRLSEGSWPPTSARQADDEGAGALTVGSDAACGSRPLRLEPVRLREPAILQIQADDGASHRSSRTRVGGHNRRNRALRWRQVFSAGDGFTRAGLVHHD